MMLKGRGIDHLVHEAYSHYVSSDESNKAHSEYLLSSKIETVKSTIVRDLKIYDAEQRTAARKTEKLEPVNEKGMARTIPVAQASGTARHHPPPTPSPPETSKRSPRELSAFPAAGRDAERKADEDDERKDDAGEEGDLQPDVQGLYGKGTRSTQGVNSLSFISTWWEVEEALSCLFHCGWEVDP